MESNNFPFRALLLLLLLTLSATVDGMARGGWPQPGEGPGRREVKAYFQATILPVLQQQRQKLEPQLSPADQAQLATYRTQLKSLKAQAQALRHSGNHSRAAPTVPRPTLADAQREQAQKLRAEMHGIMQSVAEMAHRYDAQLAQLKEEVQPQKAKWSADIKAIVAKNATPGQQQRLAAHGNHPQGPGGLRGPGPMQRYFKPAAFLLMDPNAPARTKRSIGSTSLYPNPAVATTQLEYEMRKAGPVTVDLLDKSGSKLHTLFAEPQAEKGPHIQQLNLSDLPAGTYFYKITTKSHSETKRFVKE